MNLGITGSPFIDLMIVVAIVVTILAAWQTLQRKQKDQEVDPLAEAEVYIAYGRKKEAAEILKEAINAYPGRRSEFEAKLRELQGAPSPVNPVTKL